MNSMTFSAWYEMIEELYYDEYDTRVISLADHYWFVSQYKKPKSPLGAFRLYKKLLKTRGKLL